jgi:hypothetical protein
MNAGMNNLKATAGTKLGSKVKRGPGIKLFSDYKGAGSKMESKAAKQSRKAV